MFLYLPAVAACLLATAMLPPYPQALVGVGLALYLALSVRRKTS